MGNPIHVYNLIHRIYKLLPLVSMILQVNYLHFESFKTVNTVVISQMSFLLEGQPSDLRPDEQDMEGVTQALARLQFVYRFYARKN